MTVLVTGAAGFIGFHTCAALLRRGDRVIGIDDLNDYYDPALKKARLAELDGFSDFQFHHLDIAEPDAILALADEFPDITNVVHLAAQAGVRYSLENPFAYVRSNVMGHVVMGELARRLKTFRHMVYASSSSVYGDNEELPFTVGDPTEKPTSLYGATKKADELISEVYAKLYDIPMTGLRFFTVYGPWGRPDMAVYGFSNAIMSGKPIRVFNNGELWRDFTYIDDIVDGIVRALDRVPTGTPQHAVYNLGNHQSEKVTDLIGVLEEALGKKAEIIFTEMQPGDMYRTFADIEPSRQDLGYEPRTSIRDGLPKFVAWYRTYHGIA